jgi:hypothetical protein
LCPPVLQWPDGTCDSADPPDFDFTDFIPFGGTAFKAAKTFQRVKDINKARRGFEKAKCISKSRHNIELGPDVRIDLKGRGLGKSSGHHNKATGKRHGFPHVHDPNAVGGVRDAIDDDYRLIDDLLD